MQNKAKQRSYSQTTLKALFGNSFGLCAFPGCFNELIIYSTNDVVGDIAHIVAHSLDGPRGDAKFPIAHLNEYDNLILLCKHHHAIVDARDSSYTVNDLRIMKTEHETRVLSLRKIGKPWDAKIYHLHYVNIPRLAMLSGLEGCEIEHPFDYLEKTKSLHELGYELNYLLVQFERIVNTITPIATSLTEISSFSDNNLCQYISFDGRFRTKNGPTIKAAREGFTLQGNLSSDPHIYQKIREWKFIMVYDPAWITTSTSFSELAPTGGINRFAGLCVIKRVDTNAKEVYATPLLIGIPRVPAHDIMDVLSAPNL